MNIILPVIIVGIIGLVAGIGLSVASKLMAVPTDEKQEKIREALPGANCGACGFSGCDGYAEALAEKTAALGLCSAGGDTVNQAIGTILGVDIEKTEQKVATLKCNGKECNTEKKYKYFGTESCSAVNMLYSGDGSCAYGCLGYGDCANACKFGAIKIEEGIAKVDKDLCTACGMCVSACPKALIELRPKSKSFTVKCSNADKGINVKKACKTGCIGCMKCKKVCEFDAITVENNLAKIDYSKCTGCGKCAENCPVKIILN